MKAELAYLSMPAWLFWLNECDMPVEREARLHGAFHWR